MLELSSYQKNILDYVKYENGNLLVNAKAGSGKTSTLILISEEIIKQNKKCLFLAFNKSIVTELQTRITSDECQIKTLHSLGLSFIRSYLYKKYRENYELIIDKTDEFIKEKVKELFVTYCEEDFKIANEDLEESDFKDLYYNVIREIKDMVNHTRLYNIDYNDYNQVYNLGWKLCYNLKDYEEIGLKEYPAIVRDIINDIKNKFANPGINSDNIPVYTIGYTDMIYFPCLYNMTPPWSVKPYLEYALLDECIPEDYYVVTDKRKITLKTLSNKFKAGQKIYVKSFNEKTEDYEYKLVTNVVDKGFKDVYEIETYGLNKVQATDNHPFMTFTGWKELRDLQVDKDCLILDKPENQKTKYIPNDDQLQVIYGSILGDGSLQKISMTNDSAYRLKLIQGDKQYNYFQFKKELLQCTFEYKSKSDYTQKLTINNTTSKVFLLSDYNSRIDAIKKLDPRGFAIFYMDDGSKSSSDNIYGTSLACCSFTKQEVACLQLKLREYNIETIVTDDKRALTNSKKLDHYYNLRFNKENAIKFLKLIAPYMHKDCFYKNPYATGTYIWNNQYKNYGGNIIKSKKKIGQKHVYDIEVKDNHNFFISNNHNKLTSSILVHNCQDFSVLQQLFIKLLNNHFNTRFIFVGDEKQAIYGFAGADTKSIYNLKKNFYLRELPLNICYRCPENVVKLSQSIVPEIDWNHNRGDRGIVEFFEEDNLNNLIKPGDIIIGRRNKDLVRIYKDLVLNKKTEVKFKNAEMVSTIINEIDRCIKDYIKYYNQCLNVEKDLYKICDENNINWKKADKKMTKEEKEFIQSHFSSLVKDLRLERKDIIKRNYTLDYLLKCMQDYKDNGAYNFVFEGMNENVLIDYFEVIAGLVNQYKILNESQYLKDFSVYLETFLKGNLNKNVPILSSVHMMKGGEADNVYILDYPRFPYIYTSQTEDTQQQERNLQYVALTRAKKNLYLGYISRPRPPRETEEDIKIKNKDCEAEVKQRLMLK